MTRKDFYLIAETIRDTAGITETARKTVAESFAQSLKITNRQFNPDRFVRVATGEATR